eukprot:1227767-Prymnesium_polylepis.1
MRTRWHSGWAAAACWPPFRRVTCRRVDHLCDHLGATVTPRAWRHVDGYAHRERDRRRNPREIPGHGEPGGSVGTLSM